ncbi:MAG: rpoN [Elusimicrobia bacterium]|nr:MAG: rpoN [Elusimicrobiota bacterium]
MADRPELRVDQKIQNWQLLQGRLTAAKWLSLSEPEVVKEITEVENNPLFKDLMYGAKDLPPLMHRRRWPASGLTGGFYELNEQVIGGGGGGGDVSDILEKREDLIALIRRIGVEAFERCFLYGTEGRTLEQNCKDLDIPVADGRRILDLVLEVGARSEFFRPAAEPGQAGIRYHCIASIDQDKRDPEHLSFRFMSPHWARGRYVVLYDKLEEWKKRRNLSTPERQSLRKLLKHVELINMRQDTLFQILSRVTTEQSAYLRSRDGTRLRPLSLRELARRIGVAPSTVSRAVSNRSVVLPWGTEAPLKGLLTGQRFVLLSILADWVEKGRVKRGVTDEELMSRLAKEAGITVSRRTVNEVRRKVVAPAV